MGMAVASGTSAGSGYEQQLLTEGQGDEQMGEDEAETHEGDERMEEDETTTLGQHLPRSTDRGRGKSDRATPYHKDRGGKRDSCSGQERESSKGPTGEVKGSGSSRSCSPGRDKKESTPWSR